MRIHCQNATCRGARHHRRVEACQDASASVVGEGWDGTTYGLLVIADGHGHPRHSRSAIGAQLACDLSVKLVKARVAQPGGSSDLWPQWCQQHFPTLLHQGWLQEITEHSTAQGDNMALDPLAYGTTLGIVLITERWWLCAGLGDWDLVSITGDLARIVNEENSIAAPGESTFSLCLHNPLIAMAERFALHTINAQMNVRGLILSTDGIRKSCKNDQDFLELSTYLFNLDPNTKALEDSLSRITKHGSEDDVSACIARLERWPTHN